MCIRDRYSLKYRPGSYEYFSDSVLGILLVKTILNKDMNGDSNSELDFRRTKISINGVNALARNPTLSSITRLDFSHCPEMDDKAWETVLINERFNSVLKLEIGYSSIGWAPILKFLEEKFVLNPKIVIDIKPAYKMDENDKYARKLLDLWINSTNKLERHIATHKKQFEVYRF
eukprot:TRINITY_DN8662_c0_g1_i2.p2 TRINITY_DN8662_c0_g1~~TRINITY_DN8662_c0_g1_i2.p2  ORF type:complete len:194 (-),score=35.66 TRINITY_DN8662_c0_g1_i2:167-688(-)